MTKDERAYKIADRIFWIFIENSHPKTISDFIEADPNYTNGNGTRNTESCLLYTSPSPRDGLLSRMPSSA